MDERLIPLSALQHYAFCPRQCALIHNEQLWAENYLTAHGQLMHKRVDMGEPETRKGIRYERGVNVFAPKLGLTGKLDLMERNLASGECCPVEYKRGRPKKNNPDVVQLCAQALCLEEMTGQKVEQGALWYWQTRHREPVVIDAKLRILTCSVIEQVHQLFASGITPPAKKFSGCKSCSLLELCMPDQLRNNTCTAYVQELFTCKEA